MDPLSLIKSYNQFVISHIKEVGYFESLLQGGYNFTRFGDNSQAQSEAVYAVVNLLSLYHDILLIWKQRKDITESPNTDRVFPIWWEAGAISLSSIAAVQIFVEVYARSKKQRWNAVLAVEILKAFIKLIMLKKAKGAVLVKQKTPPRATLVPKEETDIFGLPVPPTQSSFPKRETLLDRVSINENSEKGAWRKLWMTQADRSARVAYVPTIPTPKRTIGEVVYILRPVLYVILLSQYGRKSWTPWLGSLFVEVFSYFLSRSQAKANTAEKEEYKNRVFLWVWYLFRSPFFENILCAFLRKLVPNFIHNRTKSYTDSLGNIIAAYRELYYYTSGV